MGDRQAISRSVPLRLVYVTKPKHPSADDYYEDIRHAEASLRAAQAAVEAAGKPVKVETAILDGPAGPALVEESRDAEIICVGSVGIGRSLIAKPAGKRLGALHAAEREGDDAY
jgi:nucleotide-binding universal stress UspA family protein